MDSLAIFGGNTKSHHHERNLRNSGEREDTLDIDLCTCHTSCIECRDSSDNSDECQRSILKHVQRKESSDEINTCDHHGSSVNECRHWGRTLHRIGEPNVKRKHCRLTHTSGEYENQRPCEDRSPHECSSAE